jgi:signal transduction histidine kinase
MRYVVDVEELIRDQVAGMVAAGQREERFVVTANPVPAAFADPDKLRQVLANLLENAVRHGDGRVSITIALEAASGAEDDSRMIAVTVDDEGPGIPQEMLGRVFTRFWRGNRRGGTGLGLYIVKGIIEAHGGTITVGTADSGGARFRFTVPVYTEPII